MCSCPHTGFMPKYGQKLRALGEDLELATSGEEAAVATKNVELELFGVFPSLGDSERVGFGEREKQELGFPFIQG